jgi:hypothetical protein
MQENVVRKRETFSASLRRVATSAALSLVAMLAMMGVHQTAAHAATSCGPWHTIAFGQTGLNLKVESNGYIYASGGPDYWNQQLQFCRDPGWGSAHYAIHSNRGGLFWSSFFGSSNGWAVCSCSAGIYEGFHELFEIKDFDGNFFTIRSVGTGRYLTVSSGMLLLQNSSVPLNGTNLFLISPRDLRYW